MSKRAGILLLVCFILANLILPVRGARAAGTVDFQQLRERWTVKLNGGSDYDLSDPGIADRVGKLTSAAQSYWDTMDKSPDRTYLWSKYAGAKVTSTGYPANTPDMTSSFTLLKAMAKAFAMPASSLYHNDALKTDILDAINWMLDNSFTTSTPLPLVGQSVSRNWWDWEIGSEMPLSDTLVILYPYLSSELKAKALAALDFFNPDPSILSLYGSSRMTGANLVWTTYSYAVSALVSEDADKLARAADYLRDVPHNGQYNVFVNVDKGDGFYDDGSFIQHNILAYTGGYGTALLSEMLDMMEFFAGTPWDMTNAEYQMVYNWVFNAFAPLMSDGRMTDMVRGRNISRSNSSDHDTGADVISSVLRLSAIYPDADGAAKLKALAKSWIQSDTYRDYLQDQSDLGLYAAGERLLQDQTVSPAADPDRYKQYAMMDRVVQKRPGFALAVSMSSSRIANYESINNENLKGWYTGDGMTYLYNSDLSQYSNDYWPTVNPYRLPGTTVDTQARSDSSGASYRSSENWVGGTNLLGQYGTSGMWLDAYQSTLEAKKSWFMFDDEIVALGSGINSTDNRTIETTIANTQLDKAEGPDNVLTVNGVAKPSDLGWSETMSNVQWAHLEGNTAGSDVGYYFPDSPTVDGLREARTGSWYDINKGKSQTPITRDYATLWFDHGANPSNATYSYVMLPGKSSAQTGAYAANPDIDILANTPDVQAVKEKGLQAYGYNFWNRSTVNQVKAYNPMSVMLKEGNGTLDVSVSDPTQAQSELDLQLGYKGVSVLSQDPGVTVEQLSPTIKLKVDTAQAQGKTFKLKLAYDASAPTVDLTPRLTQINLTPAQNVLGIGDTSQLSISGAMDDGSVSDLAQASIRYASSDPAVATVSPSGLVTAAGAGEAIIKTYVTLGQDTRTAAVKVIVAVQKTDLPTIVTDADTFIRDGSYGSTNYGTSREIDVACCGSGYTRYGLVHFTLPSNTENLSSATLSLNGKYNMPLTDPDNGVTIGIYEVNGSWSETGTTFGNKPPIGQKIASGFVARPFTWYSFDLTSYVKDQIAKGNKEINLYVSGGKLAIFYSKDAGNGLGPKLDLQTLNLGGVQDKPIWMDGTLQVAQTAPTSATLTWSGAELKSDIAGYRIFNGTEQLADVPADSSSYALSGLSPNTTYSFRVEAYNNAGLSSSNGPAASFKLDSTPPVTTAETSPAEPNGLNGWFDSSVTVSLHASDTESGVAATVYSLDSGISWQPYTAPITFDHDSVVEVTYRSTDKVGNVEDSKKISFKLDATPPAITVLAPGNGTYEDDADLTPSFTVTDNLSLVDQAKTAAALDGQSLPAGNVVPLYTLPLGSHRYTVTASDQAGNERSVTVHFVTIASFNALDRLVTRFAGSGWIDQAGVANSLHQKLQQNDLQSFIHEVEAQRGKHIANEAADFLLRDVHALLP